MNTPKRFFLLLTLLALLSSACAYAGAGKKKPAYSAPYLSTETECYSCSDTLDFTKPAYAPYKKALALWGPGCRYCITRQVPQQSSEVLLFLHPKNLNETFWAKTTALHFPFYNQWKKMGRPYPTVISISFGPVWFMAPQNQSPKSGLLEAFMNVIVPEIEQSIQADTQARKLLMGFSMGGYNATQLLLKYPEKIKRAAIMCPGIMSDRLFKLDSREALERFISKTENYSSFADADKLWAALTNLHDVFPSLDTWNSQASPVGAYGRKHLGSQTPPLLLYSTRRDPFLIFEGVSQFAELAQEKMKGRFLWLPREGLTHCFPFPARPTAHFLAGQDLSEIDTSFSDEPTKAGKQDNGAKAAAPCCD